MGTRAVLLGDTHGDRNRVARALRETSYPVIHMGDFGFGKDWIWGDKEAANRDRLHVIGGNHDDYDVAPKTKIYLGDFGDLGKIIPGADGVFFIRGAYSIDKVHRLRWENAGRGKCWWRDEELSYGKLQEAIAFYEEMKPHTVLAHDCPQFIVAHMHGMDRVVPNMTGEALQQMYDAHQPDRWFSGHHHLTDWTIRAGKMMYRCIGINQAWEIDLNP